MRLAIMQPYFMPYLPYWQMINAVDVFVVYDDVNYINRGWINRNFILLKQQPNLLTIPLRGASQFSHINQIKVSDDMPVKLKLLRKIKAAYGKAPYFDIVYPILDSIILYKSKFIIDILIYQFQILKNYLSIDTEFLISSKLGHSCNLKGSKRILSICKYLHADTYINAIGGRELYDREEFNSENIQLFFIENEAKPYKQFGESFVPNLSMIDVLMFNSAQAVREMMNDYKLV